MNSALVNAAASRSAAEQCPFWRCQSTGRLTGRIRACPARESGGKPRALQNDARWLEQSPERRLFRSGDQAAESHPFGNAVSAPEARQKVAHGVSRGQTPLRGWAVQETLAGTFGGF